MGNSQVGGYIFEKEILDLLSKTGYFKVSNKVIEGRGASHQIDACGLLTVPTPFIYPIRLICEAKFRPSTDLPDIRNFLGVYKDIAENYIANKRITKQKNRFTDLACIFSKGSFSSNAQNFAWAHNIFLISFYCIQAMRPITDRITEFLDSCSEDYFKGQTKEQALDRYQEWLATYNKTDNITLVLATFNLTYPVILVGNKKLLAFLESKKFQNFDQILAQKNYREETELDILFNINFDGLAESVQFSIPRAIAEKVIKKIDRSKPGSEAFALDIPFVSDNKQIRRVFKVNIKLPL